MKKKQNSKHIGISVKFFFPHHNNSTNSYKIFCVAQHFCELILAHRRRVQSRNKEVYSVDKTCNMCASFIYFLFSGCVYVAARRIQFPLKVRPQNIPHVQCARLKTMGSHQPKSIKPKIRRGGKPDEIDNIRKINS